MNEENKNQEVTNEMPNQQEVTEKQIEQFKEQLGMKTPPPSTDGPADEKKESPLSVVKDEETTEEMAQSIGEHAEKENFQEEEKEEKSINEKIEEEAKKYPKPTKIPYLGYKVPMKRNEVPELFQLFVKLGKVPNSEQGGKWGYFVIRNAQKCRSIMKETDKKVGEIYPKKEDPREKEYRDLEFKLFEEFSEKDPNGNPIMEGRNFKIKEESRILFNERMNLLRKEYEDVMEMYKSLNEKSTKIGNDITYIENPYMMYSTNIPAGLTPAEQEFLDAFIIEVE